MDFTKEELEIISHALNLRECRMIDYIEAYKSQNNIEAQKDCMNEFRKTTVLNNKIRELARSLHTADVNK